MSESQNVLYEVKPRLTALIEELTSKGADRLAVLYIVEKEVEALRNQDHPLKATNDTDPQEPANDWPAADGQ